MRALQAMLQASLLVGATAHAAGWSTADRSVVAMGTGGAGAARADDPGAAAYNPASGAFGPTEGFGLSLSAGAILASARVDAGGAGATDGKPVLPPHLHAIGRYDRFAVGASLTVPFGSRVEWPDAWAGRYELERARLEVIRTLAFGAARFGDVSVAVGPFFDSGRLGLTRSLDFIEAEGRASIDTTARGVGLMASVFARPLESLDVGLTYQSRSKLGFRGYADFTVPDELRGRAQDQALRADVTLPDRFTLGALYRALPELELTVDLELTLWTTVDALVFDFEREGMADLRSERDWKTTLAPRAGAAYAVLPWLIARAGLFLDPTPVPGRTVGPAAPDSTRVGVSLGAGFELIDGVALDLGYQHLRFLGQTAETGDTEGTRYGGHVHLAGASVRAVLGH